MNFNTKRKIKDLSGLAYRLLMMLKDDIDMLRSDANIFDMENLNISVNDTIDTLEKLTDTIAELEYILYCHRNDIERP